MTEGIYAVAVPKWGIEMQEGTIVAWHVEEGQEVARGDELIDVETDKIINTMEAPASGVLRKCLAEKGDTLRVGALLGVIASADVDGDAVDLFISGFNTADSVPARDEDNAATRGQSAPAERKAESQESRPRRVRVSPAAARRAKELGVDISRVRSAGRRISPQDVERYARTHGGDTVSEPDAVAYESIPLSATRQSIARKLVEAKQQIPHFYLSMDVIMDDALRRREEINTQGEQKVSVNDIVMRAVVLALQALPEVNIHLVGDEIRRFHQVNLAMAVATERGLMTPVIQGAEALTLVELAKEAAALGERARSATLTREDLDGGTFTVTNLGMFGISEFQAIINPPQCAILALGTCEERLIPNDDVSRNARMMRMTLSCDHRAVDGALGARFLYQLKTILESPGEL